MRALLLMVFSLLVSPAFSNEFAAVGRIENNRTNGSCTGSLIAEDVVLTAAHCVHAARGSRYVFRLSDDPDLPTFAVKQIVWHPLYAEFIRQKLRRVRFDIAVVQLAEKVPASRALPFATSQEAMLGEELSIVSWRKLDREVPRKRDCLTIEGAIPGLVALDCAVVGGESGAPVLRKTATGHELVSVISSQSTLQGRPIAYASDVRLRVPPLLERLGDTP